MSEIVKAWFFEVKKLQVGESLLFRVADKKEQTATVNAFEQERAIYSQLDTVHASQLFFNKTLKSRKQYVSAERKHRVPFTAFKKAVDGKYTKLTIDPDRRRQIFLMQKDKKSREEVEDALNGLTDSEIEEFYREEE